MVAPRRRRPPAQASAQSYHLPAPVGGLNTVQAGLAIPPTECVQAINVVSAENGLRSRLGWRERATGVAGTTSNEVRTMLPFAGAAPTNVKLFATTDTGIYDVTSTVATPSLAYTFASSTGNAGYGVSAVVVTAAGHFLLYADEVNGLHVYNETGSTWSAVTQGTGATQIDGIDPARLAFVTIFKGRVWLVERDTANAWYLPTGQIYGTASKFPLAAVFKAGGSLVGLWSWTYDGGSGLDDSLVAVSSGGDVLVYQGTDPASVATFGLRGVWYLGGRPPVGRRIGSSYGGDLVLLSRQGLLPMSRLVVGAAGTLEYATAKIDNLLNRLMLEKADTLGWGVVLNPEDNTLMLLVPRGTSTTNVQLAQSSASRGWFLYTGLPMLAAAVWEGQLYFGTADGRVGLSTGYVDEVRLADTSNFQPVEWQVLTGFSNLGSPRQKRVGLIRPLLVSETRNPAVSVAARYNYDQTELDAVSFVLGGPDTWDTAIWDVDVWGGDQLPDFSPRGAGGVGADVAIAVRGSAIARTVLVGLDVTYSSGGFL